MRGKNPTRKQKIAIKSVGLNPNNWLVTKTFSREIQIVHRNTGTKRVVPVAN